MRTATCYMSISLSAALAMSGVVHAKAVSQCLAFAQPPTPALMEAAAQGNVIAETRLGTDDAEGIAAPKDRARALKLLTAAARQGYAPAQYQLGKLYAHDLHAHDADLLSLLKPSMLNRALVRFVMPDDRIAQHWYRQAARQGYAPAEWARSLFERNAIIQAYVPGSGRSLQWAVSIYQRSLYWLARAAKAGFAPAELQLVEYEDRIPIFHLGLLRRGTPSGTVRFAGESRLFNDAATQGYGLLYRSYNDAPVTASHSGIEAANWQRLWVAMPTAYATHGLNAWNPQRQGIPQNPHAALTYLEGKAIAGDAAALTDLGLLDQRSDPAWARALFVRATRQGDPAAEFELGRMLQPQVPPPWPPAKPPLLRTPPTAAAWQRTLALWSKAADQGDGLAEMALTHYLMNDESDDPAAQIHAESLLLVAAARVPRYSGFRMSALHDLRTLTTRLSPSQQALARARALTWIDAHGCGPIAGTHRNGLRGGKSQ